MNLSLYSSQSCIPLDCLRCVFLRSEIGPRLCQVIHMFIEKSNLSRKNFIMSASKSLTLHYGVDKSNVIMLVVHCEG